MDVEDLLEREASESDQDDDEVDEKSQREAWGHRDPLKKKGSGS